MSCTVAAASCQCAAPESSSSGFREGKPVHALKQWAAFFPCYMLHHPAANGRVQRHTHILNCKLTLFLVPLLALCTQVCSCSVCQVQLAGGHVTERITDATTHILVVPAPGDVLGGMHPEKLLSAVSEQAGGKSALIIMQRLLKEKALDVVLLR